MSRVLFLSISPDETVTACLKHSVGVSVAELLPSGGTRLVLKSPEAASVMAKALGRHVMTGDVARYALAGRGRRS